MEMAFWETGFGQRFDQDWIEKGDEALRDGNHVEAAACFGKAVETDPFNARAYTRLSSVYRAQGKTDDCLNSLMKALELDPGDRETVLECVSVFGALGKENFAKEVLGAYLKKYPQDAEMRSRLDTLSQPSGQGGGTSGAAEFFNRHGEIQFGRGSIAHATACFEMAIEEDPLMGEAYNNLGVIELQGGKILDALNNFHKALELKPEDGDILANSARGLALVGQVDAAINVYRQYLSTYPQDDTAWEEFEALVRQSGASAWKPDGFTREVADIYRHTAEQLLQAGDLTGASEAIDKALRIDPDAPDSLYVLASLHCAIGQKADAGKILQMALLIDPEHGPCSRLLKSLVGGDSEQAG